MGAVQVKDNIVRTSALTVPINCKCSVYSGVFLTILFSNFHVKIAFLTCLICDLEMKSRNINNKS